MLRPITACGLNFATHEKYLVGLELKAVVNAAFCPERKSLFVKVELYAVAMKSSLRKKVCSHLVSSSRCDPFFRLLYVDDNSTWSQMVKEGLGVWGFEVITASYGIDALTQFQARPGDFASILLDNDIPERALEFVKAVRARDFRGQIFVISERLSPSERQNYRRHAVRDFLPKPFDIGVVATLLLQTD